MSTAEKLQQLRLERQKSDLSQRLYSLQDQLSQSEREKGALAEESGKKIKQALSLLDNARKEIDKLRSDNESLRGEVSRLTRENAELRSQQTPTNGVADHNHCDLDPNGSETLSALAADRPRRGSAFKSFHRRQSSITEEPEGDQTGDHAPEDTSETLGVTVEEAPVPDRTRRGSGFKSFARRRSEGGDNDGVQLRRTSRKEEEKPMSMAERMSMFEGAKSNGGGGGGGGGRKSWRSQAAPPMVKLVDAESDQKKESEERKQSYRKTVPPNMFSQKQIASAAAAAPPPSSNGNNASSGLSKMKMAVSGMTAAMETERTHRGLSPKPPAAFVGLVAQVAPKTPVGRSKSAPPKNSAAAKKAALLHWCQRMTSDKQNVNITNFSSSWNDGMAFCALFHHFIPNQIPYGTLDPKNRESNFRLAFTEGEKAGVTALLDVEDCVEMKNPDWMSVMTYVSLIYNHFNGIRVGGPRLPEMPSQ